MRQTAIRESFAKNRASVVVCLEIILNGYVTRDVEYINMDSDQLSAREKTNHP